MDINILSFKIKPNDHTATEGEFYVHINPKQCHKMLYDLLKIREKKTFSCN